MKVKGGKQQSFFNISFFVFSMKKETHTGLQQLEGEEMMTEFSFLGGVCL